MAATTTRWGFPYQEVTDPPDGPSLGQDLAETIETEIGSEIDAHSSQIGTLQSEMNIVELSLITSRSAQDTSGYRPLVTSANVDTAVVTLSNFDFKGGYVYELLYSLRAQISSGTGPNYVCHLKLKRATASGTVIHDPAEFAMTGLNFMYSGVQGTLVRVAADTTQTLVLTAAYGTTGSPTGLDIESSSACPAWIGVKIVGLNAAHGAAPFLPTS